MKNRCYYKEPRESEMSLNEQIFVGAVESSSNDVFRGVDGVEEGAYADDNDE